MMEIKNELTVEKWLGEDNALGIKMWHDKYQYNNETFEEWLDRVSGGDKELRQLIVDKKFIFGGRILAGRGVDANMCLSNCFVLPAPEDNIESIFDTAKESARTFSYGGGVGFQLSKLRPKDMKVNNSAKTTTGSVSFMDLFSKVTEIIGQNNRKGALMLSLDVSHPDIESFINVKTDLDAVTKANISVMINDEFMKCVEEDKDWVMSFTTEHDDTMTKTAKARDLFNLIAKNNHMMGEPGVMYMDRIHNWNLTCGYPDYKIVGTNPCFTGDMRLLTDKGFKTLKELCDEEVNIISYDGKISKGKVWCNGEKDTIKLTMSNNKKITCTPDHRFMTIDGDECEAKNLKGKKIMPKMYKTTEDNELFIKLGFIQGDGNLSRLDSEYHDGIEVNIGNKDGDIRYLFEDDKYTVKSYRAIYLQGYNDLLDNFGFSHSILPNRTMPKAYKDWSIDKKSNFLQGCFSANGCVNSNIRVSYKTTCKEFALELIHTLENDFGITANLTVNKKHMVEFENGEYECKESYDVNINKYEDILLFAQFIGFYQTYKKIKLEKLIKERVPYVRSIKDNGKELVYDFNEPINHWGIIEGYVAHNCGEQPLSDYSSCLLGSINLSSFVINPFTNDAKFDLDDFKNAIRIVVKAMDDVLEENIPRLPLDKQREKARDWRQVGIGQLGLSNMLIKLGIKYGSEESIQISKVIAKTLINESIKSTALLSKERGSFPKYDLNNLIKSKFYQENIDDDIKLLVEKYGMRNCALLSIAPTGSIGTMLEESTGIEPNFKFSYTRKTESLNGGDNYFKVHAKIVKDYLKLYPQDEDNLPDYFVESDGIKPLDRIKMQSTWQQYIDTAISSTVNLPEEATIKDIEDIYMNAWKYGCKGITVFRNNCERVGILTTDKPTEIEIEELKRGEWKSLAEDTYYIKRNLTIGCGKLKLFVGFSPSEQAIQDVYITKSGSGGCEKNLQCIAILISSLLRVGADLSIIEKSFSGVSACPSFARERGKGNHLSDGSYCGMAILKEIKLVLKELTGKDIEVKNIKENNKLNSKKEEVKKETNGNVCPECGEKALIRTNGCDSCLNCGYSKCS